MRKRILLAMSGGVDSSTAAVLLKDQGYDVSGLYLIMRGDEGETARDIECAKAACDRLNIELLTRDMRSEFERDVVSNLCTSYLSGLTPNPCVVCNERVKIRALMEERSRLGFDLAASGHYARTACLENGRFAVRMASSKDQSYFLYRLSQDTLQNLVFPLGDAPGKDWTRNRAKESGIDALRPDSQEICFISGDYADFVIEHTGIIPEPGDFVDTSGKVMGRHRGITYYTVGQRKGLGAFGRPVFVCEIDSKSNRVVLGDASECLKSEFEICGVVFSGAPEDTGHLCADVKIFSRSRLFSAEAEFYGGGAIVRTKEPCRAARGQSAVFYGKDGTVLAGGFIK